VSPLKAASMTATRTATKRSSLVRRRLDNCGIWAAGRTERTEVQSACGHCQENETGKEQIFPHRIRNKGRAIFSCELMIFVFVRCSLDDTSWHRPFVNSELQHHQEMKTHETDQHSWNHEDMQARKIATASLRQ